MKTFGMFDVVQILETLATDVRPESPYPEAFDIRSLLVTLAREIRETRQELKYLRGEVLHPCPPLPYG